MTVKCLGALEILLTRSDRPSPGMPLPRQPLSGDPQVSHTLSSNSGSLMACNALDKQTTQSTAQYLR